jgi:hypothetical protein
MRWRTSRVAVKRYVVDRLFERRKYPRLVTPFRVTLAGIDQSSEIEAVTHDISQTGSLILTPHWHAFTQDERIDLGVFLPPEFTGQPDPVILRGQGIVRRLDPDRSGIAVEFLRNLRTFEPSREVDA